MAVPWQKTHKYYFVLIEVVEKGRRLKRPLVNCAMEQTWHTLGEQLNYIITWNRNTRRVLLKVVKKKLGSNN